MGRGLDERELRRRAVYGSRDEVEAFGSGAPDSLLLRREGVLAAVVPSAPQRSVFNSVSYESSEALAAMLDELQEAYLSSGVKAWTVWVPDHDRATAELLGSRGHKLDGAPRAMAIDLANLSSEPRRPEGIEVRGSGVGEAAGPGPAEKGEVAIVAELNDRAYGYGPDGFRAAFVRPTAIRWSIAFQGEEPLGCVGTIAVGDGCCVSGVATPPEHRGRGIAGWLLWDALDRARRAGLRTASLRASKAGAGVYERLGFADAGFVEMWELREAAR